MVESQSGCPDGTTGRTPDGSLKPRRERLAEVFEVYRELLSFLRTPVRRRETAVEPRPRGAQVAALPAQHLNGLRIERRR